VDKKGDLFKNVLGKGINIPAILKEVQPEIVEER
jgi:hypothetical protein